MTDREKLYELMDAARAYADLECDKRDGCSCCPNDSRGEFCLTPWMVDHLLANGVVVREKGEWVDHFVRDWRCSNCGEKIKKVRNVDGYCYDDKPNFCPNCGADMTGGDRNV